MRQAQNDEMLYQCLISPLKDEFYKRIVSKSDSYTTRSQKESGVILLKVIISESHINTRATITHIRRLLGNLDVFMNNCDSDITTFNQHVRTQRDALMHC